MYICIVIFSSCCNLGLYYRGVFLWNLIYFFFSFEQRLIVCLEESLYIHNIRDMKVLHTIRDTPPNPHGLCALSINNDNCFLAYPGSNQIGEVQIFDTINLVRFFLSIRLSSFRYCKHGNFSTLHVQEELICVHTWIHPPAHHLR